MNFEIEIKYRNNIIKVQMQEDGLGANGYLPGGKKIYYDEENDDWASEVTVGFYRTAQAAVDGDQSQRVKAFDKSLN